MFEAVLLQLPGGDRYVPISEIARVEDRHQEQQLFARLNGAAAVRLSVMPQPAARSGDTARPGSPATICANDPDGADSM
jgi:multidrug efflux pump subunit AcrB